MTTEAKHERYFGLLRSIKDEGVKEPITVEPGNRGPSIREVVLDFFGLSP